MKAREKEEQMIQAILSKGDTIYTMEGIATVKGFNGELAILDEKIISPETGETEAHRERTLTREEVANVMFENAHRERYKVWYEEKPDYWIELERDPVAADHHDSENAKWALHEVRHHWDKSLERTEKVDEVIIEKTYKDTGCPDQFAEDYSDADTEASWKAIDECIEKELGFLPQYSVN